MEMDSCKFQLKFPTFNSSVITDHLALYVVDLHCISGPSSTDFLKKM